MATVACKLEGHLAQPAEYSNIVAPATAETATILGITPPFPGSEQHILSLLSSDSLTNLIMAGFIRDNGFINPINRGQFYVCRDGNDKIEGIALLGHSILFEAFSDRAIQSFAAFARRESSPHLLMGEHSAVERFWSYYAIEDESPRLVCPILFLQRRGPFEQQPEVSGLRLATRNDLEHVVQAQAAMALETSGVDPLKTDAAGFRERYLRRIEKKRVWVLIENGRLLFKTDIITDTPQASYIEGVYVTPEERGKGLGRRCLIALGSVLLERSNGIYLFVENQNTRTKSFYLKLGFSIAGQYDLLYF
ncbi:MAG TPA: GNAT family N-acetyltransferase [Pyrinomonadaceae bacterium]|nr:GNAT family N-acetyltransferase [Pyrinomonadaceae bacterium]